jgi:hypothetical protein
LNLSWQECCKVLARIQTLSFSFAAYFSTLRMEASSSWEILINAFHVAWCHVPEFVSHLTVVQMGAAIAQTGLQLAMGWTTEGSEFESR